MDNGLPESGGELRAWRKFYEKLENECEMLRVGPNVEFSPVASYEITRVREILHKITLKLARLEKKGKA